MPSFRTLGLQAGEHVSQALAPIVALVDGLVSRVDKLERDLSAARLRNDRMRAELLAMEGALGGAQTLIAAGIGETTSWTCDACGPVMSADQWQAANAFLARLSDLSDNG